MISQTKLTLSVALLAALSFSSCQSTNERTGKGAAAGAVLGGAVGAGKGGAKGAAIGAATGAAAGAAIGAYLDRRASELAQVVPTKKTENGLLVTLKNDLLFDFDEASLKEGAKSTLSELANILERYPNDELRLAGFTDQIGSEAYNQELSKRRADAVKGYLADKGVSARRIAAIGMGESKGQETTDKERQQNRRVEIYIQPELPESES